MSENTHWCPDCVPPKKTKSERIAELEKKVSELEAQLAQHRMTPHWPQYWPWWNWNYPYHPGYYGVIPCGTVTAGGTQNLLYQNTSSTYSLSNTDPGVPNV